MKIFLFLSLGTPDSEGMLISVIAYETALLFATQYRAMGTIVTLQSTLSNSNSQGNLKLFESQKVRIIRVFTKLYICLMVSIFVILKTL